MTPTSRSLGGQGFSRCFFRRFMTCSLNLSNVSDRPKLEDKNNMPSQKCRGTLCQLAFGLVFGVDDGCDSVVGEIARHRVL